MAEQLSFQITEGGSIPTSPLHIKRCNSPDNFKESRLFVNTNHSYIKWVDRPSRKLYWLLYENGKTIGVFGLSSAYSKPKLVQTWMAENDILFNNLACNIVFCLAGSTMKNAGSRLLALLRRDAKIWWLERYGDILMGIQTFILPPRTGAIYKADNWKQIGSTTGGITLTTKTLSESEWAKHPEAKRYTFKSGDVRYLLREFKETEPKLMFVRKL
uniref:Uncharacterized protein n=1 Tax=viral metagenome TaxID=1070528 RepID=A0A6M3LA51_9ZZZZ